MRVYRGKLHKPLISSRQSYICQRLEHHSQAHSPLFQDYDFLNQSFINIQNYFHLKAQNLPALTKQTTAPWQTLSR